MLWEGRKQLERLDMSWLTTDYEWFYYWSETYTLPNEGLSFGTGSSINLCFCPHSSWKWSRQGNRTQSLPRGKSSAPIQQITAELSSREEHGNSFNKGSLLWNSTKVKPNRKIRVWVLDGVYLLFLFFEVGVPIHFLTSFALIAAV